MIKSWKSKRLPIENKYKRKFYKLPFKAIQHLLDKGIKLSYSRYDDLKNNNPKRKTGIIRRLLMEIDEHIVLEIQKEVAYPYDTIIFRL
ncbi:MAG TPA: hypothetical protein EYP16_07245, partial [Candidatus Atribacteria bacterium]|nr:hypothetical protein [Candidatus Atribacteria bacterium]